MEMSKGRKKMWREAWMKLLSDREPKEEDNEKR